MAHKEIEKAAEELLAPVLEKEGIEIVDVVYVKLFAPLEVWKKSCKTFTARLGGLSPEGNIVLTMEDGTEVSLPKDKVSQVRLHFSF